MSTLIQRANGNIIYFDTAESVVKDFPNKVTTHPIEDGSPITDHVVSEPRKITVTGVISDAAFQFNENDPFTELGPEINGVVRRVPIKGRSLAALNELQEIRDNREIFQMETANEVFTDLVFTMFQIPRDASTGDAARVKFTAQQISTVQRSFVTIPLAAVSDADKAAENAETGKQSAEDASDASALLQGSQSLVGIATGLTDVADIDAVINSGLSIPDVP